MERGSHEGEKGAALIAISLGLVVLLGMSALAVDLGWYYLNGSRMQRAADAAALAGVVHLPASSADAAADAATAARLNDFGAATLMPQVLSDNRYRVTLSTDVPTFFASAIGFSSLPLSRTATAEYVKPVPMGSPLDTFGYGFDAAQGFWAAINAPYSGKENGDPYMTQCVVSTTSGACRSTNPEFRPEGYHYAVEVPSGARSLQIQVYDAGFYHRSSTGIETGDYGYLVNSAYGGGTTNFQVLSPDTTPLDPADNAAVSGCSFTIAPEANPSVYKNRWATLCSRSNPVAGIWVVRVWSSGGGGGSNMFSLRATTGSGTAKVYGVNDMSVYTNDAGNTGTANVHLAEIAPEHAGKQLQLRFFDPGEGQGNAYMTMRTPAGSIPNCSWYSTSETGAKTANGNGQCRIQTTTNGTARFNGQWITAVIEIPDNYTCTTDCWWKMDLQLNSPHDRTTWEARVIGNPLRLVPNE